jgi:uncharacterized secreted protein with C-terminal beta-propeller domain
MRIDTKIAIATIFCLAVILGGVIYFFSHFYFPPPISLPISKVKGIKAFLSEEDFKSYLEKGKLAYYYQPTYFWGLVREAIPAPLVAEGVPKAAPERVSETNVQVPGIDEPDIVKTDGKEIYFSKQGYYIQRWFWEEIIPPRITGETKIIRAFPPEELKIDGKIEKSGDLILKGNILVIFSGDKIYGYDVSKPDSPEKKWEIEIKENGLLVGARLFKDKIYFVTKNRINEYHPCPIKPLEIEGKPLTIECPKIYHPIVEIPIDVTYNALILDPASGKIEKEISFVGSSDGSIIYMSENGLYITNYYFGDIIKFYYDFLNEKCKDLFPDWVIEKVGKLKDYDISLGSKLNEFNLILEKYKSSLEEDERRRVENEFQNRISDYAKEKKRDLEKTGILKIDLESFEIKAHGEIPGRILNQFSLDEYKSYLRIATTVGENSWIFGRWIGRESANDVYVLDKNLKIVGSVKDLGLTERIYSARFIEDKGYLVTFRQTDPFYVLDLSKPEKPELKGQLKIPGYSSYLHPIEKNKILGIGKEGWQVKISLFDVSDPENPKELDKYILDESWSDILNTHHAFLLDPKHQIFFLPGSRGGYVFSYKEDKLELKKVVSDIAAKRAIYINNYLYIIGENKVVVLNELNWEKINESEV